MARTKYTIRCSECGEKWSVVADEMPRFCIHCGVSDIPDPNFVPTQMNIGTIKGKVVDQTYRQLEESSIQRAEMAGDPSLKITNLKDGLREGDIAAMPVNNMVTQYAESAKQVGFDYFQASGTSDVAQALQLTKNGQERTTGARGLKAIQESQGVVPQMRTSNLVQGKWGGGS